jgi:phage terminase large subunit-like protein
MAGRAPSRNHPTTKYALDVQAKRIIAGPYVRQACERHLLDLQEGHKRGLRFDTEEADSVFDFYERCLRHPEGKLEGEPFVLQPFQKFIRGSQFGWQGPEGQRFRISITITGKGAGKTPLGAGGCLHRLFLGGSADQIYCAGFSGRQATEQLWTDCKNLVLASPDLASYVDINNHTHRISRGMSFIGVFSSESQHASGFRVSHAAVDELQTHRDNSVLQETQKGTKNADNPLIDILSNSTGNLHSVCGEYTEWAQRVLAASVPGGDPSFADDELFAYICALDPEDYQEEEGKPPSMARIYSRPFSWVKANPGLGTILKESYLAAEAKQAVAMPGIQQRTMQLNFCVKTDAAEVWIPDDTWMACAAPKGGRDLYHEFRQQPCFGGMDLARSCDLSALALAFPPHGDREKWAYLEWYWIDQGTAKDRAERDRVPYLRWISEGYLQATPGNVVDFEFVEEAIIALAGLYNIQAIAYDRTFAGQSVTKLGQNGLTMVPWAQTPWNMEAGISEIERQVKGGLVEHSGHPITRWCLSNVSLRSDPQANRTIDKERSREKVDGASALGNAIGWGIRAEPATKAYDGPGVLAL